MKEDVDSTGCSIDLRGTLLVTSFCLDFMPLIYDFVLCCDTDFGCLCQLSGVLYSFPIAISLLIVWIPVYKFDYTAFDLSPRMHGNFYYNGFNKRTVRYFP